MLVYVNQLNIVGENSFDSIVGSIIGWLKKITREHFHKEELTSGSEFEVEKYKIKSFVADARPPKLYSIILSHPDEEVKGRYWNTEIGIRVNSDNIEFTLLLEVSDISTQVRSIPSATRPLLIEYVKNNCQLSSSTFGIKYKNLETSDACLAAFLSEIEREERRYPLVLISTYGSEEPVVSPIKLQNQLLGLAQVVFCNPESDKWLMAKKLTRRYSSWDGAINIIFPSFGRSWCKTKLLRKVDLDEIASQKGNVCQEVLSHITHFSNGYRQRQHFSSHDVRAKRAADRLLFLRESSKNAQTQTDLESLLEEAFTQIEEHDHIVENLHKEYQAQIDEEYLKWFELEEEVNDKSNEIFRLKQKVFSLSHGAKVEIKLKPETALELVKNTTPENALNFINEVFNNRVEVLDSAWTSSRKSESFEYGEKLVDLLWRLCTEYYDAISSGPECEAKKVFSECEFAAKESETVMKNRQLKSKRTFNYNNMPITMFRHLKIGVKDSAKETIRVHFHWDSEKKIIAIGYCGPHLPLT
ncbi:hypothetical protein O5O45_31625 [Hahella aquimaris]|uniref:hypothetical protein n=1 Tax=Hahella sp. HNIBRBA332 TaxID=3015983 RepID=UPI00273CE4EF|nr:hypothetical protein [Hahella sp. HNIBRBA332]WLQ14270.1 hypothetical protein O5O45_31625 [Hahella sp. HNIBRBA332]